MYDELSLIEAQHQVHQLIERQAPLEQTLESIASWIDIMLPGAIVAYMRFDPVQQTLSLYPSQRFSQRYQKRLQNVPVGPSSASFGCAAFQRKQVISEDLQTDARWSDLRDAAEQEELRACWSSPLMTTKGELLGTFSTYYRQPCRPNDANQYQLRFATGLVALAVVRDRDAKNHRSLSEWHRSLFVNHPDGVYEFDLEGRFQRGNAALTRITGYPESAIIGQHFSAFIEPAYQAMTQASFDIARQGGTRQYETRGTHRDGHGYDLEVLNFPVSIDDEIVGVYGICRDITARKQDEASRRLLERGVQATPNGIIMADAQQPDMPLVYANDAFYRLTGYQPEDVLGRNCRFLQGWDTDPQAVATLHRTIDARLPADVTLLNYRKDGTSFWNRLTLNPVFDKQDICTHYIGIQQDITQQRELEVQLAYQANYDLLTGLPNRTVLGERLADAFKRAEQQQTLMGVMYIDLDGFKTINDGLGHHIGNLLLVAVAERLRQLGEVGDTVARLAGDEFFLLLPDVGSQEKARQLADRLLEAFSVPFRVESRDLMISASIGIACNVGDVKHAHELMQRADLAMSDAKQKGRNTWYWYRGDIQRTTEEAVLLHHDLHTALKNDQFELYYQPIVESANGRIRGVEALVRWHHLEKGMVSPGVFIPLAEQTGQIIPLGQWVLHRACQDTAAMHATGKRNVPVAVNISSLQFGREGFLDGVQQALAEAGLAPELLELEVTESVLLDGAEKAIELINQLKQMGVKVALDDFGTGFSSLSYLRDLPIHKVKLDRAFIKDIVTDHNNAAIVQGIITMAHQMHLIVVAEGIEEHEQQIDLALRECDLLQGFYFAKPMPWAEVLKLPDLLPAKGD